MPDRLPPAARQQFFSMLGVVRLHLAAYGPASRRDVAWWSGLGLRQVDSLLDRLDLTWRDGPGGLPYADVPDAPAAAICPAYAFSRSSTPCSAATTPRPATASSTRPSKTVLWHRNNGYMLAPVLVDGRIGGYWRIEGSGREKTLAVSSFAGSRKPRKAELDARPLDTWGGLDCGPRLRRAATG